MTPTPSPHEAPPALVRTLRRRRRTSMAMALASTLTLVVLAVAAVLLMALEPNNAWWDELLGLALLTPLGVAVKRRYRRAVARHHHIPVTEDQFPDLHALVVETSTALGLPTTPPVRLVKDPAVNPCEVDGGVRDAVVLGSDFVAGCRENDTPEALRFMVAHQLGHFAARHNSRAWHTLVELGSTVPVLRTVLTRNVEFTADLHAAQVAPEGALGALSLCALGKDNYPYTNPTRMLASPPSRLNPWGLAARWVHNGVSPVERFAKLVRVCPRALSEAPHRVHDAFDPHPDPQGPAMTLEIERTFTLPDDTPVPDLSPVVTTGDQRVHHLHARYFDTPDLTLARHHITLRRREGGSDAGWHLKLPGNQGREEVHHPLTDDEVVPDPLRARVADLVGDDDLVAIAVIDNERTETDLLDTGSRLVALLCDDHVSATRLESLPPRRDLCWREIEVELAGHGNLDTLEAITAALTRAGATLEAGSGSKLVRTIGVETAAAAARRTS